MSQLVLYCGTLKYVDSLICILSSTKYTFGHSLPLNYSLKLFPTYIKSPTCRYNANDYYLKQLIEEWCEGILQGNNQNLQHTSSSRTDLGGSQSLLLEKVAANLQKTGPESLAVDLRGLTKVD